MAVVTIRPTSSFVPNPDYQHWSNVTSPSGTSVNDRYTLVDEAVADEDTTHFQCATNIHSFEFFGMGDTGVSEYNITNVRAVFRCKHVTATGYSRAIVGTGTSAYSYGDTKTSTTSYQTFTQDWTTNPRTGVAWVWSDFTNYYFGVEGWGSATKSNNRCTQFYVEISYTLPQTTIQGCIVQGCIIS
jgi:hypothetical protein